MHYRITPNREPMGHFSILGFPVHVQFEFLLFMGLIYLMNMGGGNSPAQAGLICIVVFFSLILHEFGHAFAARRMGCRQIGITLVMFGGYATHSPTTPGRSLLIVVAGPLVNLIIIIVALFIPRILPQLIDLGPPGAMSFLVRTTSYWNIILLVFNILPIFPLDGGQALNETLKIFTREQRAMYIVSRISLVACVLLGIFCVMNGMVFAAIFSVQFFMTNLQLMQTAGDWR